MQSFRSPRLLALAALAVATGVLAGCGGGGGGSTPSGSSSSSSSGGGTSSSSSSSSSGSSGAALNTLPLVVDGGPSAIVQVDGIVPNFAYVSVTICAPGSTSNCQTIDHVQLDTQSVGLRIMGSVLNGTLLAALPHVTSSGGQPVFECAPFADGYSWGMLSSVDIHFTSSEQASSVPVQIIEDPTSVNIPAVPTDCKTSAGTDYAENTPATFEANGLLGIGALLEDCGAQCVTSTVAGSYYACTSATSSGSCADITMGLGAQVQNPVAVLNGQDTNGVVIALPAASPPGAVSLSGTFTESNNALGSATVFAVDNEFGMFLDTRYAGVDMDESVLDAGSSAYYFNSNDIVQCTSANFQGYYCPASTSTQSATIQGETAVGVLSGSVVTPEASVDEVDTVPVVCV